MEYRDTLILGHSEADLKRAADILANGGLVSFPTETVYGLGADARHGQAVASIFAAKNRPNFNPLIVHVASTEKAGLYAELTGDALRLAQTFWPGPLTLVLPLRDGHGLSDLVTAGLPSVGLRVPDHPIAQGILSALDGPIAAPSANPSGRISPTIAQHVLAGLTGKIDAVVDGGPCAVGLESTIVGFDAEGPVLLRPGGLPVEAIEAALSAPIRRWHAGDAITAPGQLTSHYAPSAPMRLNAETAKPGEVYLGFGDRDGDLNLSPSGDLKEAAARLFGALHQLDAHKKPIAVAPIPNSGLGQAINDRLSRAAAPRQSAPSPAR